MKCTRFTIRKKYSCSLYILVTEITLFARESCSYTFTYVRKLVQKVDLRKQFSICYLAYYQLHHHVYYINHEWITAIPVGAPVNNLHEIKKKQMENQIIILVQQSRIIDRWKNCAYAAQHFLFIQKSYRYFFYHRRTHRQWQCL